MNNKIKTKSHKKINEAMINIPLADLRYLSLHSREKKIIIEISTSAIKRVNKAETLDEIINDARLDYLTGNFSTHKTAKSLIAALEK